MGSLNIASGFHPPGPPQNSHGQLIAQMIFLAVSCVLFWLAVRFDPADLRSERVDHQTIETDTASANLYPDDDNSQGILKRTKNPNYRD